MTNQKNIQEIILGCVKNNPASQRALVCEYSGFLYAICRRYIKDSESAKDAVQESFIRVLAKINLYDAKKGRIESWLSTIAIRICINTLRKKRISTIDVDEVYSEELHFDAGILQQLSMQELYKLIHQLPIKYKEVFNLHVIDGFSHIEIGELLSIEVNASRTRLSRAKIMLREKIELIKKQESCVKTA